MDRNIVYTGSIPQDVDVLAVNKNAMVGLGSFIQDVLGTSTQVSGLGCSPTSPAGLNVVIAPGRIYSQQNIDNAAYGSLPVDTAHQIVKQGILLDPFTISCPAPATFGFSVNYLIQAIYQDIDTNSVTLPYYNSANPQQAFAGPGNNNAAQPTLRKGAIVLQAKSGGAATTGTQNTPSPDVGFMGLWVVTVANGQTTITSTNIAQYALAAFTPIGPYLSTAKTQYEIAAGVTVTNPTFAPGNVMRYGADNTGAKDSTAAFNAATIAIAPYSLFTTLADIVVPPGQFRIDGTVYVRKGQRIRGSQGATYIVCNVSGTGPTFKMGWGLVGSTPTVDGGGQPVGIQDLFLVGGPALGCIDFTNIAGGFVSNMFISAPAIGLNLTSSSDLNINNVIFDQGLNGIVMSGCGNLQFGVVKFFLMHFDVTIGSNCYDSQFDNFHSEYNQFTSVLFADSATNIYNIRFTDSQWTWNEQFTTYTGAIQNRASGTVAFFHGCSFNNMPGYAYVHGLGTGSIIEFADTVVDGTASAQSYITQGNQSTKAAGFNTFNETLRLVDCTLKNLPCSAGVNQPVLVGGTLQSTLEIEGGKYFGNSGASLIGISNSAVTSVVKVANLRGDAIQTLVNNQSTVAVSIRNCHDWFGAIGTSGASHFVLIPYQFANLYRIALRANINSGGSASYRKCTLTFAEKDNDFATSAKSIIATSVAVQGAANTNGLLATVVEFGSVGGGTTIASSNSGSLAVSWPNTYSSESIDIQQVI